MHISVWQHLNTMVNIQLLLVNAQVIPSTSSTLSTPPVPNTSGTVTTQAVPSPSGTVTSPAVSSTSSTTSHVEDIAKNNVKHLIT